MARWQYHVKMKHLFTRDEDHESVQASMDAIADVIEQSPEAFTFLSKSLIARMRNIPAGDEIMRPVDYANRLLEYVYDFADEYGIWIE